jgi:hypothetical protein
MFKLPSVQTILSFVSCLALRLAMCCAGFTVGAVGLADRDEDGVFNKRIAMTPCSVVPAGDLLTSETRTTRVRRTDVRYELSYQQCRSGPSSQLMHLQVVKVHWCCATAAATNAVSESKDDPLFQRRATT